MIRKKILIISLSLLLMGMLLVTACNNNKDGDKSPEAVYTEAAQTVAAKLTDMASEGDDGSATPTWTPEAEFTPTPETEALSPTPEQPTPTTGQQPTQATSCTLKADYVADITVPDNTVLATGQTFTKTWQIMNAGTCTWGNGYTIYFVSGDDLGAGEAVSLTRGVDVAPGTLINVSIDLTAPSIEGSYRADFKFKDPSGTVFGTGANGTGTVYLKIVVAKATPQPSNTPQPSATPTPTIEPSPTPDGG